MFRTTKKKQGKRVVVTSQDDDESDGSSAPAVVVQRRPTKKRPRQTIIRSFDETPEKEKKRKKRKRLGFGAAASVLEDGEDEENSAPSAGGLYNKDALQALKSKQSYREPGEKQPELKEEDVALQPELKVQLGKVAEESYIALNDSYGEPVAILAGDDADATLHDDGENDVSKPHPSTTVLLDDGNDSDWEAQVTKRAGVSSDRSGPRARVASAASPVNTKSLEELHDQLASTLSMLKARNSDVQAAYKRRLVEVDAAEVQVQEHQTTLHASGEAFEYYQELRLNITNYVGALRALRQKLLPLQETRRELSSLGGGLPLWKEWEGDVVAVLRPVTVLGRQPKLTTDETETTVDEFGRDVKSQFVLARERRLKERETARRDNNGLDGTDPTQILSLAAQDESFQRQEALQEALTIAVQEMDDCYTSLDHLVPIFQEWCTKFPQEYQSCHAGMSLADLASVLIHVDLLTSHYPLSIEAEFPNVHLLKDLQAPVLEETPLYRTVDKVLIPVFQDVLPRYNPHSTRETKSMALYFSEVQKLLPPKNILINQLSHQVVHHLNISLQDLCIPIVDRQESLIGGDIKNNDKAAVREAVDYATSIQVTRIQIILSNIFIHWMPLVLMPGEEKQLLSEPLLDFVSSQFLSLASSLGEERCREELTKVWKYVKPFLQDPEYIVAVAPLLAAATVYELQ